MHRKVDPLFFELEETCTTQTLPYGQARNGRPDILAGPIQNQEYDTVQIELNNICKPHETNTEHQKLTKGTQSGHDAEIVR